MQLYATVGANDIEAARDFYAKLLGSIGWTKIFDNPTGGAFYGHPQSGMFAVVTPYDERPATAGNGSMIGFALDSRAAVDAFYAKAMSLGGSDEGPPGFRGPEDLGAYFAYFRDPEGNKLCAFNWTFPA